jgi:hypothetical protein
MLKGRDLSALRSLSEDIALLKVDSTGGEQFRFDAEKSTWRTEQGFGRFRLAAAERKEFLLPGALHAHPVTGRSATRVTWQVKQPSQLLVFAALTSAAAKTLQTGDGDGSLVRVRMQDGEELGCLRVVDAEPQLMVLDVPAVGTVVLTVEAGAAQNSRYDSTWLGIYEMSLGTADKRR